MSHMKIGMKIIKILMNIRAKKIACFYLSFKVKSEGSTEFILFNLVATKSLE